MRHPLRSLLTLVAFLASLGTSALAQGLDLANQDNNTAAGTAFAGWAKDQGYKVIDVLSGGKAVAIKTDENFSALVEVKPSKTGLDRLVLTMNFKSGSGQANRAEKLQLANAINETLNLCSFSIDEDGDFEFTFVLTFDDQISPGLFRKFIKHVDFAVGAINQRFAKEFEAVNK